jgi:septum formation protein
MELILASASPRRAHLLEEMGLRFRIVPARVEERHSRTGEPEALVRHNSLTKAAKVARSHPSEPVLGADSMVSIDGTNLDKPVDLEEARKMLENLSGRTHRVFTGVTLILRSDEIAETICVSSAVTFKALGEGDIKNYLATVNPLDKAGAYGIQEGREMIIQSVAGSVSNVMGLPMERLADLLRRYGLFDRLCSAVDESAAQTRGDVVLDAGGSP